MTSPAPVSADALDANARGQIMDELVETAATLANAQLDAFTTRLAQALQDAGPASGDPALARLHAHAAALLRKNRYPFSYVTAERLRAVLQHELLNAARGAASTGETSGALKSLAPDVEVDKTLCLRKAARAIEDTHSEQLASLTLRLASLFGRAELAPAQHPFRAQLFLNAVHDAWCEFQPDTAAHPLVYPLLGPGLCLDLAPILHAVSGVLVKRGILPQLQVPVPARAEPHTQADVEEEPLAQRLHALLDDPAPSAADAAHATAAFPVLLDAHAVGRTGLMRYLDSLEPHLSDQHLAACGTEGPQSATVLAHVLRHAPEGSVNGTDEKVIELLAAIFDSALRENAIATEMKVMIASLQLPVLRAALADRSFFFRENQPARRAIELLAELALDWDREKGNTDPLYLTFRRNVERISRGVRERSSVFSDVIWDLEAFIQREQTASDQILAPTIAEAIRHEKRSQAERNARREVELRIGTGEVVAFVETFLEDKWVPVLTLVYEQEDEPKRAQEGEREDCRPQAMQDALKTMDELVWSVKPKITAAERKALLSMLPRLVADLNRWLDRIEWHGSERARFFSELAACHVSLVRAPLELSPQRQVELALEAAQKAAERRQQRLALQLPETEPDEFDRHVSSLQRGAWLEFAEPGGTRRLKLAWVSPMGSLFIFATRARKHALSLSDEALAAALRERRATIVEAGGLVRRALSHALGIPPANQGSRCVA